MRNSFGWIVALLVCGLRMVSSVGLYILGKIQISLVWVCLDVFTQVCFLCITALMFVCLVT